MADQVHKPLVYVYARRLRRADGSGYAQGAGMKHKHAELIHAWADGAVIQHQVDTGEWEYTHTPRWFNDVVYRIKPQEKPPVVRWLWAFKTRSGWQSTSSFYTDSEVVDTNPDRIKLEWTRTEFPE